MTEGQWLQASLPVRLGGLGVRRVFSLASSAFLASAVGTRDLQNKILQFNILLSDNDFDFCLTQWRDTHNLPVPDQSAATKQRSWDKSLVEREFSLLMQQQADDHNKARLLAVSAKHSGDWLHATPISSCGLRLDDEAIRIAVGLRLGAEVCQPHTCTCGNIADALGTHALSCKRSSGKFVRHNSLNELIYRALIRANIPASKEPLGLSRTDGKRPDGSTLIPWREGRCLLWDVTVANTTASSYLSSSAVLAGSAAESAAARKVTKYAQLSARYDFLPIAMETLGSMCSTALSFLSDLGRRTSIVTSDARETSYLFQRLSIALQRFNAVCIYDTFGFA
jgi:hypothetical protein